MRYWVHLGDKLLGPLAPEQLAELEGLDEHVMLCPENKEHRNRKNWNFLRSFPEAREEIVRRKAKASPAAATAAAAAEYRRRNPTLPPAVEPARRAAAAPQPQAAAPIPPPTGTKPPWAIIAAVGCGAFLWFHSAPERPQAPPPAPVRREAEPWQQAAQTSIPSCGRTLQEVAGGSPAVSILGGSRLRLGWGSAAISNRSDGIAFEYNEATTELRPLTQAAKSLLDLRRPCPR